MLLISKLIIFIIIISIKGKIFFFFPRKLSCFFCFTFHKTINGKVGGQKIK